MPLSKQVVKDLELDKPVEEVEIPEDPRYFVLSKPIVAGQSSISRLLLDPSELTGSTYARLALRFDKEHPGTSHDLLLKTADDNFNRYWIAELNPPITPEDLNKLSFIELDLVLGKAKTMAFQAGMRVGKA